MANKLVVLFDLNIILDVLQKRIPFFEASANLLAAAERGEVQGYLAAHSFTTLVYLIKKGQSSIEARATITKLLQFLKVSQINQNTIEQALNLEYRDFEDAVQMISAVHCNADYLVTRNLKDYQSPLIPVIQPVDLLATL
jgi:predicted nucleic acid-binding protein